jgi:hypothetical protein
LVSTWEDLRREVPGEWKEIVKQDKLWC